MKLFSLGRTDLAVSSKLPTPVGIANCRRTIIVLRTSVMVRYTWRSPWTVVFAHCVQSSNDNRCRDLFQNKFFSSISFLKYSVSWYHRITEHCIINRLYSFSKVPPRISILARSFCGRTVQTTANNRHVFPKLNYSTAHPVFRSPATFNLMSNRFWRKNSFLFFDWNSKSRDREVSKAGSTSDMPSRPAGQALFYWKVWMTHLFNCSSYVEDKKVREKKIKKITHKFFSIFIFS